MRKRWAKVSRWATVREPAGPVRSWEAGSKCKVVMGGKIKGEGRDV
jgi:hypothetical protein